MRATYLHEFYRHWVFEIGDSHRLTCFCDCFDLLCACWAYSGIRAGVSVALLGETNPTSGTLTHGIDTAKCTIGNDAHFWWFSGFCCNQRKIYGCKTTVVGLTSCGLWLAGIAVSLMDVIIRWYHSGRRILFGACCIKAGLSWRFEMPDDHTWNRSRYSSLGYFYSLVRLNTCFKDRIDGFFIRRAVA